MSIRKQKKIKRYGSRAKESIKIPHMEFSLSKEAGSHYVNAPYLTGYVDLKAQCEVTHSRILKVISPPYGLTFFGGGISPLKFVCLMSIVPSF